MDLLLIPVVVLVLSAIVGGIIVSVERKHRNRNIAAYQAHPELGWPPMPKPFPPAPKPPQPPHAA